MIYIRFLKRFHVRRFFILWNSVYFFKVRCCWNVALYFIDQHRNFTWFGGTWASRITWLMERGNRSVCIVFKFGLTSGMHVSLFKGKKCSLMSIYTLFINFKRSLLFHKFDILTLGIKQFINVFQKKYQSQDIKRSAAVFAGVWPLTALHGVIWGFHYNNRPVRLSAWSELLLVTSAHMTSLF